MNEEPPDEPPHTDQDADALDTLWAKSPPPGAPAGTSGERLTVHSHSTLEALLRIRRRIGTISVLPDQYWTAGAWAALTHDAGKVALGFQHQLGNGGGTRRWRQRHEVLSLGFLPTLLDGLPDELRLLVATGVATHHRPLYGQLGSAEDRKPALATLYRGMDVEEFASGFGPIDPRAAAALARWFARTADAAGLPTDPALEVDPATLAAVAHEELDRLLEHWEEVEPDEGVAAVLLQGAVTMADHLSSAHGQVYERQPLNGRYHSVVSKRLASTGDVLHPHQEAAAATSGHLLLRSPTGSGKTEAALLWAANAINDIRTRTGGEPRLFYTLPYLASINAMAGRLGRELDAPHLVGVSHSRAASYHLAHYVGDDESDRQRARKAVSRAHATRLFREPVRVGTPYQLLRGALAGPIHSSVLLDTANSLFVLDELHAYDAERLGMILAALELWVKLGGRVAVLSATFPEALLKLVAKAIGLPEDTRPIEPAADVWPSRHVLRTAPHHLTAPESLDAIRRQLRAGRSVLVVANNVRDAQAVYGELGEEVRELYGPEACGLLHSRFRRMDRSRTETAIMERYGTGRPRQPGLLVATQTVEVSLDVDFDTIHTSGAPLEALFQRFGRVNRAGKRPEPADVVVHPPEYTTRKGEEWADGVYAADPTRITWDILTAHDGSLVDERALTGWLDKIYGSAWGNHWRDEVRARQVSFRDAFLTFDTPFTSRDDLADRFDEMFDGTEAILASDRVQYQDALDDAGRIFADEYLIPLPTFAVGAARWDKDLRVRVVDAEYSSELGLGDIDRSGTPIYRPGEVL